jgi:hypothetical protein
MKILPLIIALLPALAFAGDITDNFDRDSGEIGDGWEQMSGVFSIQNEKAINGPGERGPFHPGIACWSKPPLTDQFRAADTVSLNTMAGSASVGIAFNCQDADHYYALRISGTGAVQLIYNDGEEGGRQLWMKAIPFSQNHPYRLEVSSTAPGVFSGSVADAETNEVLASFENVRDPKKRFQGGFAGLYSGSGAKTTYDDFVLSVP